MENQDQPKKRKRNRNRKRSPVSPSERAMDRASKIYEKEEKGEVPDQWEKELNEKGYTIVPIPPKEDIVGYGVAVDSAPKEEPKIATPSPTSIPQELVQVLTGLGTAVQTMANAIDKMDSRMAQIEHQQSMLAEQQTLAEQSGLGLLGLQSQGPSDQRAISTLQGNRSVEQAVAMTLSSPDDTIINHDPEHIVIVGAVTPEEAQRRHAIAEDARNNPEGVIYGGGRRY